jgi:hypothetical protein
MAMAELWVVTNVARRQHERHRGFGIVTMLEHLRGLPAPEVSVMRHKELVLRQR